MPRLLGSTSFMRWLPISSSPPVMDSRPAINRSKVDLPQPDGPTKTTNSLSSMSRSMPLSTSTTPKDLRMLRSFNPLIGGSSGDAQADGGGDEPRSGDFHGDRAGFADGFEPEAGRAATLRHDRRAVEPRGAIDFYRHGVEQESQLVTGLVE